MRRWRRNLVLALYNIAGRLLMRLHLKQPVGSTSGNRRARFHKSSVVWLLLWLMLLWRWLRQLGLFFTVYAATRIRRRFRSGGHVHGANRIIILVLVIYIRIIVCHWQRVYIGSVIIFGSHSMPGEWNDSLLYHAHSLVGIYITAFCLRLVTPSPNRKNTQHQTHRWHHTLREDAIYTCFVNESASHGTLQTKSMH